MIARRKLMGGSAMLGLSGILPGGATAREGTSAPPTDLYQVDDRMKIIEVARQIIEEDYVGVLVTIDEYGMPRARPIGVARPKDDWSLWMSTRRGSRKTFQIEHNPKAALHFGYDDIANDNASSFYASFTGIASVHTDIETIAAFGPSEKYRVNWPDYPRDLAVIRLIPHRLEVMGKGIWPTEGTWQPQGILLT